jgi:cytochrome c556
MVRPLTLVALASAALLAGGALVAQEQASPAETAHEAREAQMHLQAISLGQLGPMAQGEAEYDAAVAQAAADNLHHLAQMLEAPFYWTPGSAQGEVEGSRALPAIWENMEDVNAKITAFQEAAAQLQTAAGTDLAGLQGAIGGVGETCGACHDAYRADEE